MRSRKLRQFVPKAVILLILGAVLAVAVRKRYASSAWVFVADLLFAQGCVFMAWGLMHQVSNMHMFTSFTWGFRSFHRLVQGRQEKSKQMKDNYLAYRQSRRHHDDVGLSFAASGVLILLSLILTLLIG